MPALISTLSRRFRVGFVMFVLAAMVGGCHTTDASKAQGHTGEEELSLKEMRAEIIAQMRAAGASPAQIREVERQLDAMARQMKSLEHQAEKMERSGDH